MLLGAWDAVFVDPTVWGFGSVDLMGFTVKAASHAAAHPPGSPAALRPAIPSCGGLQASPVAAACK
jgi:hypothetical protein